MNPDANDLRQRASLVQAIRQWFIDSGYLEVDTPVRIPGPAPEAHIEPVPTDGWFLQTSPELCMKRLLAAGIPKIFQICKCFRQGERGDRHLPEFTMLEWYRTGIDYQGLMTETEKLFLFLAETLIPGQQISRGGATISLQPPWERITVYEAFRRYAGIEVTDALARGSFEETFVQYIEPRLGNNRPAFLYDYPAALGSLARLKKGRPALAERFELYIGGLELANGFSELTDVPEQTRRFRREIEIISGLGRQPVPMPRRFLEDLGRMPEAAGIALGVDRLAMLFYGAAGIDEVVAFTPEDL